MIDPDSITKEPRSVKYFGSEIDAHLSISAWTSYPDQIKFHSVDFLFQDSALITTRYSYGILELLRDVGGLGAVLRVAFTILVPLFGDIKILSLVTQRGYLIQENEKVEVSSYPNYKYGTPKWLCMYFCCCCTYSRKKAKRIINTVQKDIKRDLDFMGLIRRLRVHGECLSLLLHKKVRDKIVQES